MMFKINGQFLHTASSDFSCPLIGWSVCLLITSMFLCAMFSFGLPYTSTSRTCINLWMLDLVENCNRLCDKQHVMKTLKTKYTFILVLVSNSPKDFLNMLKTISTTKSNLFCASCCTIVPKQFVALLPRKEL
jgi:hypothetical protein